MNELTPDEQGMLVDAIHDSATVIHKGQRMNERIRELAEQAYDTVEYNYIEAPPQKVFNKEKFAELIVKECAGIYSRIDNGNLHMGTDNYLEALQKHFGVEE